MNQRFILGMLATLVACSGKTPTSSNGTGGGSSTLGGAVGAAANGGSSNPGNGGAVSASGGSGTLAGMGGMAGGAATTGGTGTTAGGATTTAGAGGTTAGQTSKGGAGAIAGGAAGGIGTAGTPSAGGSGGAVTSGDNSVLERNKNPTRDGHFVQPTLTKAAAATMAKDAGFKANFKGSMWASPLYLENGPGGKGVFFAVTTGNDVIALDETTGAVVWTRNIGSSPTANGVSCGNIHPLGILSTPVIDAVSRTIYVAGAIGTTSIARHEVHALNVDDGTERAGWPVDVSTMKSGSLQFTPPPHNQRSALSLVGGTVYVAYGGHVGDCGDYRGWVVGIDAADPTKSGAWATGSKGEGIWAPGGMASDGNGVLAITGNSTNGTATHFDSEQVVRITGLGQLTRNDQNLFYPSIWRAMDDSDADFGSTSPVVINVGGTKYIVAITKNGHFFLLDPANLGGMGGHLVDFTVTTGNMSIRTVPGAYTTSQGVHVMLSTESGGQCPAGGPTGRVIMSVRVNPGTPPTPSVAWCATLAGGETTAPIATTTNGTENPLVWYMSGNRLTAVDGATGAAVYSSTDTCTGVRRWTSPIAVKGRIVTGGDTHLCSWSSQ